MVLNLRAQIQTEHKEDYFDGSGDTQEQIAQRGGGCPVPGNIRGNSAWGSVEDITAGELDQMTLKIL